MGDIPNEELTTILELRCGCAPSHSKLLVKILNQLQTRRSSTNLFQGKNGLITPRDLLKWAERMPTSKEDLAFEGAAERDGRLEQGDIKITYRLLT